MKAYSIDLRQRIVQAVDGGMSLSEASRVYRVGRSTVKRYLSQHPQAPDAESCRHELRRVRQEIGVRN